VLQFWGITVLRVGGCEILVDAVIIVLTVFDPWKSSLLSLEVFSSFLEFFSYIMYASFHVSTR
jgi:hypothetical protein